ncbi:MAG TPA: hypothetical protein VI789_02680 [Dehalococcoidia bacterium]|nr:hypothetical protein [Dehalococcoidia bacterium]
MHRRLVALIGTGLVLAVVFTGTALARDNASKLGPKVDYAAYRTTIESEDFDSGSFYIDLSKVNWESEDSAQ